MSVRPCICLSASPLGDPNCPVHGTARAVTAEYGDPPDPGSWCPDDSHAASCSCHLGGPIMVDIPPAVGESARQRRVRERGKPLPPDSFEQMTLGHHAPNCRVRDIILAKAGELISGDRERDYGAAIDGFTRTGQLWAAILGVEEVSAEQVALMMAALKISRLCVTPNHQESWVDGVGYLALGGDIAATPDRYL